MNQNTILNNIIGINPTGTLDFNGTYNMKGSNNIEHTSNTLAKQNLEKAQTNQIICENFKNFDNDIYNIQLLVILLLILILIKLYFF